jgi:hypothetical protein
MRLASSKYQLFLSFFVLLIIFVLVYTKVFDKKLSFIGDNVHYYLLGKALAEGDGFTNIYGLEETPHQHFPPAYPLIISIVQFFVPDNIVAVKILNGIFFFLSICLLFLIILKLQDSISVAFVLSLFVLLNQHLLAYSFVIMSEIPFVFFSLLSIYFLIYSRFTNSAYKNYRFWLLVLFTSLSIYIRSVGIILIASVFLYFLSQKHYKNSLLYAATIFTLQLPWQIRNYSLGGNSYLKQLMLKNPYQPELGRLHLHDWIERIIINFERYFTREIPQSVLNFFDVMNVKNPIQLEEWIIGAIVLVFISNGLIQLKKWRMFFISYILLYFLMLLMWPYQWYGTRFILPIVPLLSFFLIFGLWHLLKYILRFKILWNQNVMRPTFLLLSSVLLFFYVQTPLKLLKAKSKLSYPPVYSHLIKQAEWFKNNTSENSIVYCQNQSYFYLFSNRKTLPIDHIFLRRGEINNKDKFILIDNFLNINKQAELLSLINSKPNFIEVKTGLKIKSLVFEITEE